MEYNYVSFCLICYSFFNIILDNSSNLPWYDSKYGLNGDSSQWILQRSSLNIHDVTTMGLHLHCIRGLDWFLISQRKLFLRMTSIATLITLIENKEKFNFDRMTFLHSDWILCYYFQVQCIHCLIKGFM